MSLSAKPNSEPQPGICVVIPAAGHGKRLGSRLPKVFTVIAAVDSHREVVVLDLLLAQLPVDEAIAQVILILSPAGQAHFATYQAPAYWQKKIEVVVQVEQTGTGDAVFCAAASWERWTHLLVIWGDQVQVKRETLRRVVQALQVKEAPPRRWVLPLVWVSKPYVQYCLANAGPGGDLPAAPQRLVAVRLSREGDRVDPCGWSDVGVFGFKTSQLAESWRRYVVSPRLGGATGEVNFLCWLEYLSQLAESPVQCLEVQDPVECRGLNSPEDLRWFQEYWQLARKNQEEEEDASLQIP